VAKALAFGAISAAVLLWLTFFAGPEAVEIATLAATGVALWWFATVDPTRLVDESNRPQALLFGLAVLGCALLVTGAALLASATTFLILGVGVAAIVTGFSRAIRHSLGSPPMEE
jgi:hypothetical protein